MSRFTGFEELWSFEGLGSVKLGRDLHVCEVLFKTRNRSSSDHNKFLHHQRQQQQFTMTDQEAQVDKAVEEAVAPTIEPEKEPEKEQAVEPEPEAEPDSGSEAEGDPSEHIEDEELFWAHPSARVPG